MSIELQRWDSGGWVLDIDGLVVRLSDQDLTDLALLTSFRLDITSIASAGSGIVGMLNGDARSYIHLCFYEDRDDLISAIREAPNIYRD